MALDGGCDLASTYHRPTSKPGEHQHDASETETVEKDMVVVLHERSSDRLGHASTDTHKG